MICSDQRRHRGVEVMIPAASHTYLRDDLEPDINVNQVHALRDRRADAVLIPIGEPESQQSQRIL
jgi:hypothetical protein